MRIGAVLPTKEIGTDPGAVRDWAQGVEELGFTHVVAYDHVVGADTSNRPDWRGPYDLDDQFHEPLTLFSHLAAVTTSLEFTTGIIILPQRQTALVAKQAAQLDLLSGGRLRLGVGLGWNHVEYEALGMPFDERAPRMEEQIDLLRRLWTLRSVDFDGTWDRIPAAGLNPLPTQRPIPVWIGGTADAALRRIGRLGDGWLAQHQPDDEGYRARDVVRTAAREAGRGPDDVGVEGRQPATAERSDQWAEDTRAWEEFAATHLSILTMGDGLTGADAHLDRLRAYREQVPAD
jgi:probable F420-dependent oxidoreductase